MNDWDKGIIAGVLAFLSGRNPYAAPGTFVNPPYTIGILLPLAWVPPQLAMLFPLIALFYLARRFRKPLLLVLVGTSFPFIAGSVYANIDWIVMLGVAIGGPLGAVLDFIKPQAGVFAIVAELAKRKNLEERVKMLLPLGFCLLISIPLLASWIFALTKMGHSYAVEWNFSLFPYTIPLGIVALYLAWKRKDPIWGCVASLSLAPYFYIHSFMPLTFLLAKRDWRLGLAANVASWVVVGLILIGLINIKL